MLARALRSLRRGPPAAPAPERREVKRPSSSTEMYFVAGEAGDRPLLVVYHIQKTAGTALREVVRANLPPGELEVADDLRDLRYEPEKLIEWHREWYGALDPARRGRLCCAMSHAAGYLLPALDRTAETLVLVREPVDRVLSFYWEKRRNFLRGRDPDTHFNLLERVYEPPGASEKPPPQAWPQFFNWQSRCLLSVFHDVSALSTAAGPPPDADLWRERLRDLVDRVYLVGVQDRFDEFVELLGRRYGWETSAPRSGVNRTRPPLSEDDAAVRDTILAHNWLDAELYEWCSAAQERLAAEHAPTGSAAAPR
ncbi:MAG TPA: hypothetical protein VFA66_02155 [Gaiellaceae bacterium]|nr:hypothetical protein [Gaiellaceae bacterium]